MKRITSPRLVSVFASVLLLAAMLATPLAAHAQAAEDVWAAISVELYDLEEGKDPTLVITGRILDGIELPVDVAIAIPKDVSVAWMGQAVPDTNPDTWPQIDDAKLIEADDYNVVEFVLTEAPAVQLELVVPDEWITVEDGITTVDAEYISGGSSEAARIGVSTTHDYYLENADPEPIVDVRQTDVFYSVETSPVAEGDVLHISGTVAPGKAPELVELEAMMEEQAQAQEASAAAAIETIEIDTGWSVSPTTVVLGLLGVGILVVGYFIYRTMSASSSDEDEDDEEDADEDAADDDGAVSEDVDDGSGDDDDDTDAAEDAPVTTDDAAENGDDDANWGDIDNEDE